MTPEVAGATDRLTPTGRRRRVSVEQTERLISLGGTFQTPRTLCDEMVDERSDGTLLDLGEPHAGKSGIEWSGDTPRRRRLIACEAPSGAHN